jgi:uncharacterized protein (DUF305 family)
MITRNRLVAALAAFAVLVAAGCGGGKEESRPSQPSDDKAAEDAFLEAMVPHHESAIAIAKVAVERAETKEIRALADDILDTQRAEIAQMGDLHERLIGKPIDPDGSAHEVLGLSAHEAGMGHGDATATLKRADPFDPVFIDHMIPHHEGAIRMARVVLPKTADPELRKLAGSIVTAQKREIEHMRALREEHYGDASPRGAGHERHAKTTAMPTRAERPSA